MLAPTPLPPIVRESDATRINAVLNHDAVRPWVLMPGQEALDLSAFVADPHNVVLMTEDGAVGIAFVWHEPGVYEAHTVALPDARGSRVLAAVRSMIAFMFTATDCMELLTRVPVNNRAADAPARAVGGTLDFERAAAWPTDKGPVAEDLSVSRDAGIAFWGDLKDGPRLAVAIDRDEDGIGVVRDDFNVGADGQGVRHRSGSGEGSWLVVEW